MSKKRLIKPVCITLAIVFFIAISVMLAGNAFIHDVTFRDWDGTILSEQRVLHNNAAVEPAVLPREGYTFSCWDTDTSCVTENVVATALYDINNYDVRFLDWDNKELCAQTVAYGKDAEAPASPSRTGYEFIGWDTDTTDIRNNTTVMALYELIYYENLLNQPDTGEVSISAAEPTYGDEVTLSVTPNAGYVIDDIKVSSEGGTAIDITHISDGSYSFIQPACAVSIEVSFAPKPAPVQIAITSVAPVASGPCTYCGSTEHSDPYCPTKAVDNGAVGRWVISDVGVNVACYNSCEQSVVDAKDSAGCFAFGSQIVIADHNNQGFNAIKKCVEGTIAYLDIGSSAQKYVCTGIITNGHNLKTDLTDGDYNSVADMNPGGITCYTCNENWKNVTIVFFAPAE